LYRALVDLRVTLWPDADEPGLRLAAKRAQLILPHARSVHIARLNTMSAAVGGAR
jgi:DNA primase